jgi:hypothetical protein
LPATKSGGGLVNNRRIKDIFVAICEDLLAFALACFLVSR